MLRGSAPVALGVVGAGRWRVQSQLDPWQGELVAFQVADRDPAPAVGGADHGRVDQLHGRLLVAEAVDHLGAAAFLDEGAFGQVGGADPDAVPHQHPVNREQGFAVVLEAAHRGWEGAPERVGEPVGRGPGGV